MTGLVLQGPFLTRAQAARRAGMPPGLLSHRPDLLRVGGRWLEEVYFAFQFDAHGVRPDVASVVQALRRTAPDVEIGDWLTHPNRAFAHSSPLGFLGRGGSVEQLLAVSERDGLREDSAIVEPVTPAPGPPEPQEEPSQVRRPRPRRHRHRLALDGR